MAELTQEHFDTGIANIIEHMATKGALASVESRMVTKDDFKIALDNQTGELKAYIHEGMEIQQEWMDERFKELIIVYDVRDRVVKLEAEIEKLKLQRPANAV